MAALPAGALAVFLNDTDCAQVKIRVEKEAGDGGASQDNALVYVPKEVIQADIKFRAGLSVYASIKKKIEAYPEATILHVYDPESVYGENFVICLTAAARDAMAKRHAPKQAAPAEGEGAEGAAEGGAEGGEGVAAAPAKQVRILPLYGERECHPWTSLNSEAEIEAFRIVERRKPIRVKFWRARKHFGGALKWGEVDAAQTVVDYGLDVKEQAQNALRHATVDSVIDATPVNRESEAQTAWFELVNSTSQCETQVLAEDDVAAALASDAMLEFLRHVEGVVEYGLLQNEVVDVFTDLLADLAGDDSPWSAKDSEELIPFNSFTHHALSKGKRVNILQWHPTLKGVCAVACMDQLSYDEMLQVSGQWRPGSILVWSFADSIRPQLVLQAPHGVSCMQYNPANPYLVVVGCTNGQLCTFDLTQFYEQRRRKKAERAATDTGAAAAGAGGHAAGPASAGGADEGGDMGIPVVLPDDVTGLEQSHSMAVGSVQWMSPGVQINRKGVMESVTGDEGVLHQFVSVGGDGQVLFWDTRIKKPQRKTAGTGWGPVFGCRMVRAEDEKGAQWIGTRLALTLQTSNRSTFLATTEDGEVVRGDWHVMTDAITQAESQHRGPMSSLVVDEDPPNRQLVQSTFSLHLQSCHTLLQHPQMANVYATCDATVFALWRLDVPGPIFVSPVHAVELTCLAWSPVRPSVLLVGRVDGTVDVWELLEQSHKCSHSQSVSPSAVRCMQFWSHRDTRGVAQLLGVGDDEGMLRVFELPRKLRRLTTNERASFDAFIDNEAQRVLYYTERFQIRAEQAKDSAAAALLAANAASSAPDAAEREAAKAEAEEEFYRAMAAEFKGALGITDGDSAPAAPVAS